MANPVQKERTTAPVVEVLEPRVLFSADVLALAGDGAFYEDSLQRSIEFARDAALVDCDEVPEDGVVATDLEQQNSLQRTELIFVDTSVDGYHEAIETIVLGDAQHYELIHIGFDQSGIDLIGDALDRESDVGALHIIAHAGDGQLRLGSDTLSERELVSHARAVHDWGEALSVDAVLVLHAGDLAETEAGQAFVQRLAELTGAEVATSDDVTCTVHGDAAALDRTEVSSPVSAAEGSFTRVETAVASDLATDAAADLVGDPPVQTGIEDTALSYTENDGPVAITSTLSLQDIDSVNLESAVIQIADNYVNGEDVLAFTDQNGISGSWDVGTGTLTLTGSSSVANYEAALRSVTYENTSSDPNTSTRTLSIVVSDDLAESNIALREINLHTLPLVFAVNAPSAPAIEENNTLIFASGTANEISIDVTSGGLDERLRVSLSVGDDGVLSLAQTTGLRFVSGADNSSAFVIDGTVSDLNAALDGMRFLPATDFYGGVSLDITASVAAELEGQFSADSLGIGTLEAGATTLTDAERGEVLSFDGEGAHVAIPSDFGNPADVSLSAWVNLSARDARGAEVISLGDRFALRLDDIFGGDGAVGFYQYDSTSWRPTHSGVGFEGAGWRHLSYTFDSVNDTQRMYIDGILVVQTGYTDEALGQFSDAKIGVHGNGNILYDFNGLMDDVRVYSRALSSGEIAALASDSASESHSISISVHTETGVSPVAPIDLPGIDNGPLNELDVGQPEGLSPKVEVAIEPDEDGDAMQSAEEKATDGETVPPTGEGELPGPLLPIENTESVEAEFVELFQGTALEAESIEQLMQPMPSDILLAQESAEPSSRALLDITSFDAAVWNSFELEHARSLALSISLNFVEDLDLLMDEFERGQEREEQRNVAIGETVLGLTISLSTGLFVWILRAGSLMASFVSVMPFWRQLDPLPILGHGNHVQGESRGASDGDAVDRKLERIFG